MIDKKFTPATAIEATEAVNSARYLTIARSSYDKIDPNDSKVKIKTVVKQPENADIYFGAGYYMIKKAYEQNNLLFVYSKDTGVKKETIRDGQKKEVAIYEKQLHDIMLIGKIALITLDDAKSYDIGGGKKYNVQNLFIELHTMNNDILDRYVLQLNVLNLSSLEKQLLAKIYRIEDYSKEVKILLGSSINEKTKKLIDWVSVKSDGNKIEKNLYKESEAKAEGLKKEDLYIIVPDTVYLDSKQEETLDFEQADKTEGHALVSQKYQLAYKSVIRAMVDNVVAINETLDHKPYGDFVAPEITVKASVEEDSTVLPIIEAPKSKLAKAIQNSDEMPIIDVDELNVQMPF